MEFIRQLVAFSIAVDKNSGIQAWGPEQLEDLWIHIVNAPSEEALLADMELNIRETYQSWIDKWLTPQPAVIQEITPDLEELEEGLRSEGLTLLQEPELEPEPGPEETADLTAEEIQKIAAEIESKPKRRRKKDEQADKS